ncbi:MAG: methionyl-tRNA formyltransferase [Bacillota bacterium]|nr:methionyl-tRNA formyltransferase [Bacillota bacterium]
MKILFMGTSQFAVPSLQKLWESKYEIVGVVTQPDRPKGRGKKMLPSPVKELAAELGIDIYQPEKIRSAEAIEKVRGWETDVIVVASYGQIIPKEILDYPRLGCLNVHASLLPKYRGAAPIQRALMAGEKTTGNTIMFMDEGLDTGDIIMQVPVIIEEDMDHEKLEDRLALSGAELLIDVIAVLESGSIPRRKQEANKATYAARLSREEEAIVWNDEATTIVNKIRGLSPVPGAYTTFQSERFKVFSTRIVENESEGTPGEIMRIINDGFIVQTGKGMIQVLEVQKAGKRRMISREFLQGFQLKPGDILE